MRKAKKGGRKEFGVRKERERGIQVCVPCRMAEQDLAREAWYKSGKSKPTER